MRNVNISCRKLNIWSKSSMETVRNQNQPEQVRSKICFPQQMCHLFKLFWVRQIIIMFFFSENAFLRSPLNNLLKNDSNWNWMTECQNDRNIKNVLTSNLFLFHFDLKLERMRTSGVIKYDIDAVISPQLKDSSVKAITYVSRTHRLRIFIVR